MSTYDVDRMIYGHFAELVSKTERHPYRSNAQIAAAMRRRPTDMDVQAARIHLGARFPEEANHDDRIRLFYALSWMKGLQAHPECTAGRKRCDVLVCDRNDKPLMVIEVKTGAATAPAANQVAQYRETWPEALAVVTAPHFPAKIRTRAADLNVLLLSGTDVVDLLCHLAVHQLWAEPRKLKLSVAS